MKEQNKNNLVAYLPLVIIWLVTILLICFTADAQTNDNRRNVSYLDPTLDLKSNQYLGPEVTVGYSEYSVSKDDPPVARTMTVPFDGVPLSDITFVIGNTAYIVVNGVLNGTDELKIWKDLNILEKRYDIDAVKVYLDSPGGYAKSGFAIADQLKGIKDKYKLSIHGSGMIASAAILIFLAADERFAAEGTMFMVHEISAGNSSPSSTSRMSASDVKAINEMFDKMTDRYAKILQDNSNISIDDWKIKMRRTTYFWADEAYKWGLVTEVK